MVIYTINFFMPRLMPGDPFHYTSAVSGDDFESGYSAEQIAQLKAYYGLDQPILEQFKINILNIMHGNLGNSIYYKKPVTVVLLQRLPWSILIMFSSLTIGLLIGVTLALICIRNKKMDKAFYSIFSLQAEIPAFLVGIILLFLVAANIKWIPLSGNVTAFKQYKHIGVWIGDILIHGFLPVMAMVIVILPQFFFTARASFLASLKKPYLENAKAKGLSESRIRWHYILKNSRQALITRFFMSMGTAVGGTILVENVFAYPGLGMVLKEAVMYRDYPMIQGVFMLSALMVLISMFIAEWINDRSDARWNGC